MTVPIEPSWAPPPPGGPRPAAAGFSPPSQPFSEVPAPASVRSQAAVYLVCAVAIMIPTIAFDQVGWGFAACMALAGGVSIGLLSGVGAKFESMAGGMVAILSMFLVTMVLTFLWSSTGGAGSALSFGLVPIVGLFVLGLDWTRVPRLRPLPFLSGFLVLLGVAEQQGWSYASALVWLALSFGALSSLEADRRAAFPLVQPIVPGPRSKGIRSADIGTIIVVAVAAALAAALLLSVPSCRTNWQNDMDLSSDQRFDPPSGSGYEPGGSGSQSGSGSGSASPDDGSGGRYIPDPNGNFLIPDDGSGSGEGLRIPSPDQIPQLDDDGGATVYAPDGTTLSYRELPNGDIEVTVEREGDPTQVFRMTPNGDGTTRIEQYDDDGNLERTYTYDPNGRFEDQGSSDTIPPDALDEPDPQDEPNRSIPWKTIAIVVAVLAALGGLVYWLIRRADQPPEPEFAPPPWALALVRSIEDEGAARGRPRRPDETIVEYTDVLAVEVLPDERLRVVGSALSSALFSRREVGVLEQRDIESTFTEVVEAHPWDKKAGAVRRDPGAPPV